VKYKKRYEFKGIFVLGVMFPFFLTFQASNQSQPTEVTTKSSEWKVVGLADRSALTSKILNFCGAFSIYEIEENENPSDDGALSQDSGEKTYCVI